MVKSTNQIMQQTLAALLLGIVVLFYFFGWGIIWQLLLASVFALLSEALVLFLRKRPILPSISDGSALITATLLAISIPSIAPWWLIVLGSSFAIILGKQLYGGLGHNPFNPAMLAYVFLLIAYPLEMIHWQSVAFLDFGQSIKLVFLAEPPDAISTATILDRTYQGTGLDLYSAVVWINVAFLLGGLYLLWRRIIFWQIPTMVLLGIISLSSFLFLIDTNSHHHSGFHLFTGATMLAAFFIATDPVSGSTTPRGRLIYGFGIGGLIVMIRELSGHYPDGVAFAVLLMNILTPVIDAYTKPKTLGQINEN